MGSGMRAASNERRPTSSDLRRAGRELLGTTVANCERRELRATSNELSATGSELRAASNEQRPARNGQRAVDIGQRSGETRGRTRLAGSNKPVLPTATTSLNHYAPGPLRRQTGQPFGCRKPRKSTH
jgi:hypothetical protein